MKILEISSSGTIGTDEMGPISTVVFELSRQFSASGHDVTVVDPTSEHTRKRLPETIKLVEINHPKNEVLVRRNGGGLKSFIRNLIHNFRYAKLISSTIDLNNFDIIHSHTPMLTFILQKMKLCRCVYTAHSPLWSIESQRKKNKKLQFKKRIMTLIESSAIRKSRLTIGLGSYLRDSLPDANIAVIPSGINLEQFSPLNRNEARLELGLQKPEFLIVFVGRVKPVKGVDILLDAIRLLSPEIRDFRVFVIGSLSGSFNTRDQITPYAQRLIDQSNTLPVSFLGFVDNHSEQFKQYVSAADLVVVPSLLEPQGLVVLEALAMGKAVVASNTGGIPEMLTEEVGILVEPGDSNMLASGLKALYENPKKLENMQKESRPHVFNNFTWEKVAERYITEFNRISINEGEIESVPGLEVASNTESKICEIVEGT